MKETLYIAADHAGFGLKQYLTEALGQEYDIIDCGPSQFDQSDDYPPYAQQLSQEVISHNGRGILICDTGIGMSIAANRFPGIRAALVTTPFMAERSRLHNNANVICLGAELATDKINESFVRTWLATDFSGAERHIRRLEEIETPGRPGDSRGRETASFHN